MAAENKTKPTTVTVDEFLTTVSEQRQEEARQLIAMMHKISGEEPVMWGPSIIGFGMRKQIFKSPYQRELDRIYRYHDGLIIKASAHTDLSSKTTVPVQSFEDILNLEEELKSPIVASAAGLNATRFMIIHGDIVYVYTLGKVEKGEVTTGRSIEEIEAFIEGHRSAKETLDQDAPVKPIKRAIKVQHDSKK